jgi:hypothetical protein
MPSNVLWIVAVLALAFGLVALAGFLLDAAALLPNKVQLRSLEWPLSRCCPRRVPCPGEEVGIRAGRFRQRLHRAQRRGPGKRCRSMGDGSVQLLPVERARPAETDGAWVEDGRPVTD